VAQRTQIILEDDIDGGPAEETLVFGLEGKQYEIDLSAKNAEKLRDALAVYIAHGRKMTKSGKVITHTKVGADPAAVRAWARSRGIDVPARGRLPKSVVDQFDAEN
jgi:nucleoid-associated protein Lsr2